MRTITIFIILGFTTLTACDKKPSDDLAPAVRGSGSKAEAAAAASCNTIKSESMCREYGSRNIEAAGVDFLKSTCTAQQGEFKEEPCPKEDRVGSCVTQEGTKVYYSGGGYPSEPEKAAKACAEELPAGEWKAGS